MLGNHVGDIGWRLLIVRCLIHLEKDIHKRETSVGGAISSYFIPIDKHMQANNLEQSEAAIYLYLTFVSTFAVGATNARQCNDSEIKDSQNYKHAVSISNSRDRHTAWKEFHPYGHEET